MVGVGTDILHVPRLESVLARLGDRFVERILTEQEIGEYRDQGQSLHFLAKRFAAKEAIAKALGTGIGRGVSWQHLQIDHDQNGAPVVQLSDGALERAHSLGATEVLLSLADEKDYAVAFAVLR